MNNILEATNISKKFGEFQALSDVSIQIKKHSIFGLLGPNGAGKTTLIAALCKALGVTEPVSSPTFSLVNTYQASEGLIYHFDFYRLEHPDEALDFGLEEYLESGQLCFLEWAEKITPHLPETYTHYSLEIVDVQTRKLTSKNIS